ncbi:hypothetical protein [Thalassotalea piscium]|uniref:Uncharacterized protein n=1 Tax=Thalassotalea piscium TaxID=1230533 RepID=A0A7X0NII8_9GAMM|nr:hypothetical protein [Thalassotalea piscium]MBB6544025.1 hypothetical protein [Thalassotalea piscium]
MLTMLISDQLPISIIPSDELLKQFNSLASACNKLEAQFNFQTMTAGWYGDEERIFTICFLLETPNDFSNYTEQNNKLSSEQKSNINIKCYADDVICYQENGSLQLDCIVALTKNEQQLFTAKKSLLLSYLTTKLHKVLNLIAKEKALTEI